MFCISISHKKSTAKIREQFALSKEEQIRFLEIMKQEEQMDGCVLLMTCNRSEIYFSSRQDSYGIVEKAFTKLKGIPAEKFRELSMRYEAGAAITHLYRVICGLDSAVLGEVEIIRQVKLAYEFSQEQKCTDADINLIFQGALQLAKEMADQSLMTRLPVSVGTLTTGAALDFCKEKNEPHILLVGASGEMGTIILKDLEDACESVQIVGTTRKHREGVLAFKDTEHVKWIHYDDRYAYLAWADVIISVTNSPHYTFLAENTRPHLKAGKKLLFLDLAIPRDIDEGISDFTDCIVKNMDYIQSLAKENNAKKITEAKKIDLIILDKVQEMEKLLVFRKFVNAHKDVMDHLDHKSASWLLYRLREAMDYEAFEQVLRLLEEEP